MVVLNDEINAAREVTKTDALRLNTFQTRGYGVLGVVDSDRVVFYRRVEKKHTADSEFDIATVTTLPRVDVILTYQGAPGDLIKAAVDAGAKGIVVAGAGAGATSGTQGEGISYALGKGVFVVTTTRAGQRTHRRARPRPPAADRRPAAPNPRERAIAGEDLAPLKARLLLMLALTKTPEWCRYPAHVRRVLTGVADGICTPLHPLRRRDERRGGPLLRRPPVVPPPGVEVHDPADRRRHDQGDHVPRLRPDRDRRRREQAPAPDHRPGRRSPAATR